MPNKIFQVAICVFFLGLILAFLPALGKLLPVPVPDDLVTLSPQAEALRRELQPMATTPEAKADLRLLGSCVRASANLFTLDMSRPKPFYATLESRKWAIRRTDETAFGLGFSVKVKYPEVARKMAEFMARESGESPTSQVINVALYNLGTALEGL